MQVAAMRAFQLCFYAFVYLYLSFYAIICVFVFEFSHFCLKREEMGGWMDEGFSISNFCAIITQAD